MLTSRASSGLRNNVLEVHLECSRIVTWLMFHCLRDVDNEKVRSREIAPLFYEPVITYAGDVMISRCIKLLFVFLAVAVSLAANAEKIRDVLLLSIGLNPIPSESVLHGVILMRLFFAMFRV